MRATAPAKVVAGENCCELGGQDWFSTIRCHAPNQQLQQNAVEYGAYCCLTCLSIDCFLGACQTQNSALLVSACCIAPVRETRFDRVQKQSTCCCLCQWAELLNYHAHSHGGFAADLPLDMQHSTTEFVWTYVSRVDYKLHMQRHEVLSNGRCCRLFCLHSTSGYFPTCSQME